MYKQMFGPVGNFLLNKIYIGDHKLWINILANVLKDQ